MTKVTLRSNSCDWLTPERIWRPAWDLMDGIDLDPCTNDKDAPNVPASVVWDESDHPLERHWWHDLENGQFAPSTVFLNPPYDRSQTHAAFIEKLAEEHAEGHVKMAVLLVAARTGTAWYGSLYPYPRIHVRGRIKFLSPQGEEMWPAPFPSALFGFGISARRLHEWYRDLGDVVEVRYRAEQDRRVGR